MIEGIYEINLDGKLASSIKSDPHDPFYPFDFNDNSSKIEWVNDGSVKITCDAITNLGSLELLAQIAMRRGSIQRNRVSPCQMRQFTLRRVSLKEDGKPVGPGQLSIGDASGSFDTFDPAICKTILTQLHEIDERTLLFLMRSTDFIEQQSELSVLSAYLALELKLSQIILPAERRLNRMIILEYLNVIPQDSMKKLKDLKTLRNSLAHGGWGHPTVSESLDKLLPAGAPQGGTHNWVYSNGRMNKEAGRRVIEEIMNAIAMLTAQSKLIEKTIQELHKLGG